MKSKHLRSFMLGWFRLDYVVLGFLGYVVSEHREEGAAKESLILINALC